MIKQLFLFIFSLIWAVTLSFAGENEPSKETPTDISEEEMEIIKNLDTLEMMEMARHFQMLKEMDILMEEVPDEKNN